MSEKEISDLVREERNRYSREWRQKNPDKVRESNRRYWEKKARERMQEMAGTEVK